MSSISVSIFNNFTLNSIEKEIISLVAKDFGIYNINYHAPLPPSNKYISYFLDKELKKFKNFLLTQDTTSRILLTNRRNTKIANLQKNIKIAIYLSNSCKSTKISEFNRSYFIQFNKNFDDLHHYVIDSLIKRNDFTKLNCIEISNDGIKKEFKISCQNVEFYVVTLFKVYSAIMYKIVSMVFRNDI
jgi:hypothetical protein